ncbi:MAG: type II toxin-antitoxin system RelE/ParE family toxin [Hormoscilla sp.]
MQAQPREIRSYITIDGRVPFEEWLNSRRDFTAVVKIEKRLDRIRLGHLGNYRSVGEGVYELRIDYGPGYRVYFGQIGTRIVILLCGGDKSSQQQDIRKAKEYWRDYEELENDDGENPY